MFTLIKFNLITMILVLLYYIVSLWLIVLFAKNKMEIPENLPYLIKKWLTETNIISKSEEKDLIVQSFKRQITIYIIIILLILLFLIFYSN